MTTMDSVEIAKEIAAQRVRDNLECLEEETKQRIDHEINRFVGEVMNEVTKKESTVEELTNIFNNNYEATDKIKTSEGHLPEKLFVTRNSLLIDLFEVKHIRTIYHIFIAMLAGQFIHTAVDDYLQNGQLVLRFDKILMGFSKLHIAAYAWMLMFSLTLINYVVFNYWSSMRIKFSPKALSMKIWDLGWICILVLYYASFIYYFTNLVSESNLPPPTASIVLAELVRLIMKSYAFIRSNVPKTLNYKVHSEKEAPVPKFSKFLYYLFAPTLVYRDNYPRSRTTRWNILAYHVLEFFAVIFYVCFVIDRYFISIFKDYGRENINWKETALHILGNSPAGGMFMLCGFYLLLHVWLNFFAELLRFGDRMFYKDWWNSASYGTYYRKWNVVVHDWLYTYIYKDVYENVFPKNRVAAKCMVFFVSALVHEYILSVMFGFFFPVLFLEFFGFGVAMMFLNFRNNFCGNVFVWYTMTMGMCLCVSMYCVEFFVRQNCPKENSTAIDFFIPRIFTCDNI